MTRWMPYVASMRPRVDARVSLALGALVSASADSSSFAAEAYVLEVRGQVSIAPASTLGRSLAVRPGMRLGASTHVRPGEEGIVVALCDDFTTTVELEDETATPGSKCPVARSTRWNPMRGDEELDYPLLLSPRSKETLDFVAVRWTSTKKRGPFEVKIANARAGTPILTKTVKAREDLGIAPEGVKLKVYWYEYALSDDERAQLKSGELYKVEVQRPGAPSSAEEYAKPVALVGPGRRSEIERRLRQLDAKVPEPLRGLFHARFLATKKLHSDALEALESSKLDDPLVHLERVELITRRGQPPEAWGREIYRALLAGLAAEDAYVVFGACAQYIDLRSILQTSEKGSAAARIGKVLTSKAIEPYEDLCPSK